MYSFLDVPRKDGIKGVFNLVSHKLKEYPLKLIGVIQITLSRKLQLRQLKHIRIQLYQYFRENFCQTSFKFYTKLKIKINKIKAQYNLFRK